ncbi:MAG: MBL fold metallo-hydrolase [Bryobacterales bacterium]|nr:MBL fold metallo-hydrolase [Bryobacterales bacterium]
MPPEWNLLKVCVLATSSAGNCTFVGSGRTRILIDAGLSRREIVERLAAIGEQPEQLDAIFITHEHSDHTCGLPAFARKFKTPIYLTHLTAPTIDWNGKMPERIEPFQAGIRIRVGDLEVQSFTIPHDAIDPVGFTVSCQGMKVGLAMDLGYLPDSVKWHLSGSHVMVLESNHDLDMLKVGPYPWSVKQRVMGRKGHLSNAIVSDFIAEDLDGEVQTLVLGHLSEQNNHPEIARVVAQQALEMRGLATRLVVANPKQLTEAFVLA